jgi:hypothetical protein
MVEVGVQYQIWVPGEPVAKAIQRPPRSPNAYRIVQNDPKYSRLKTTWAYQKAVAEYAMAARCPTFDKDDPVMLSAIIRKSGRKMGDRKNVIAAIEDGLQFGGFIPDDRQVTTTGKIHMVFKVGKASAGVLVTLEISPYVRDLEWLAGWLGSKKKAVAYQERHGI